MSACGITALRAHALLPVILDSPEELGAQADEDQDRQNLEREASNHEMYSTVSGGAAQARGVCNAATCRLQNQGDEVRANERDGICLRCEARVMRAVMHDYSGKSQVNCGCEEHRCDCEAYDLTILC